MPFEYMPEYDLEEARAKIAARRSQLEVPGVEVLHSIIDIVASRKGRQFMKGFDSRLEGDDSAYADSLDFSPVKLSSSPIYNSMNVQVGLLEPRFDRKIIGSLGIIEERVETRFFVIERGVIKTQEKDIRWALPNYLSNLENARLLDILADAHIFTPPQFPPLAPSSH